MSTFDLEVRDRMLFGGMVKNERFRPPHSSTGVSTSVSRATHTRSCLSRQPSGPLRAVRVSLCGRQPLRGDHAAEAEQRRFLPTPPDESVVNLTNLGCRLYVGTDDGMRMLHVEAGEATVVREAVTENAVRDIAVSPTDPETAYIGCGLRGWGLYRTTDGGQHFEEIDFADEWVWGVTYAPDGTLYVATEPPMLYRKTTDGFVPLSGIADVPSREEWYFFYEPFEAGHVHGLTIHPDRPNRLYAGIEIGGVIYSHDGGETWQDALQGTDVHRLAVAPSDPDRVLAATGDGIFISEDAGRSWTCIDVFDDRYVKAIQFAPDAPKTAYTSGAATPGADQARIMRSEDSGRSWSEVATFRADGVAGMVGLRVYRDGVLFHSEYADDEYDQICVSTDNGETWTAFEPNLPRIRTLTAAPAQ
jgi:photosystem II stability/assembly factor-like uncharacterized protein